MKKSFLLISACLIAGLSNGQQANPSMLFKNNSSNAGANNAVFFNDGNLSYATPTYNVTTPTRGFKTTGPGGGRWYDYVDSVLGLNVATIGIAATGFDLWNTNRVIYGYTGGTTIYDTSDIVSTAMGFDPSASSWNDCTTFGSTRIAITTAKAYTIDSVEIFARYNRSYTSPAKIAVVDTLILQFVQTPNVPTGTLTGSSTIPYGVASLLHWRVLHDSINNRAGIPPIGTTPVTAAPATTGTYKILLKSTDTTNANVNLVYPRPGGTDPVISYAVNAGSYVAMSVTFKSGDATYPATGYDTIRFSDGTNITGYKYNAYRQTIGYAKSTPTSSTGTTPAYPPYPYPVTGDRTSGSFKRWGAVTWGGNYIPQYYWYDATSGGASAFQYPYVNFHAVCADCELLCTPSLEVNNVTVSNIRVYPNPADNKLAITFSGNSNATVTLSNVIGQVVASQNVTDGKAEFNTTALPAGVYVYAIEVNGERTTGRVVVAH